MIKSINIKKFGLYQDFIWPANMKPFSRVNIIYGRNYSGKTTLSRIFDSVGQRRLHKDYLDGEFELDSGSRRTIKSGRMRYDGIVRVYNADYISRNLGWLKDENEGEIRSFTLLGEGNKKAQEEIDAINDELGSIEEEKGLRYQYYKKETAINKAWEEHKAAEQKIDQKLREKANRDIKSNKYYVKQGRNYTIESIKADIDAITIKDKRGKPKLDYSCVLTEVERKKLQIAVEETLKPIITRLPDYEPDVDSFIKEVKSLVTHKIRLTKTLKELVENDLLQAWVDEGRKINRRRKRCAFCGNYISQERREELNAHFSKESEELRNKLLAERNRLEHAKNILDRYLEDRYFSVRNIYVAFVQEYSILMDKWGACLTTYQSFIEMLIDLVDERLGNLFRPVEVPDLKYERGKFEELEDKMNELINKNNEYSEKLEKEKELARNKLRLEVVYNYCYNIDYLGEHTKLSKAGTDLIISSADLKYIKDRIDEKEAQIQKKELEKKDEGLAAQKITQLLANHFGNGSLSLEPELVDFKGKAQARTKFVVKRSGQHAKNLSEGEKSLISFCYFITEMEDELKGADADKLLIYIDDPMSSLDSNHIFFMFSLIDKVIAEPKRYGQLFISTHNLEFLRYLKRISVPREDSTGKAQESFYIVKKLKKGDDDEFKCMIEEMPKYLRDYVTEYNFLFEQVYTMAKPMSGDKQQLYENDYTLYYNIGNNMRRFLECYLFYRYPSTQRPLRYLDRMFDDHVPSEVSRIVNELSHSVADRSLMVMDVPEVEKAARAIIKALKERDPDHYASLCESIGVKSYGDE